MPVVPAAPARNSSSAAARKSKARSAGSSAPATADGSSAPCGAEFFLFSFTREEAPHHIRQSRIYLGASRASRTPECGTLCCRPRQMEALLHAARSSSSSHLLEEAPHPIRQSRICLGVSRASRTPECWKLCSMRRGASSSAKSVPHPFPATIKNGAGRLVPTAPYLATRQPFAVCAVSHPSTAAASAAPAGCPE